MMFRRPLVARGRPLPRAAVVGGGAYMLGRSRARAQAAEARFQDLEERTAEAEQAAVQAQDAAQQVPAAPAYAPAPAAPMGSADPRIAQLQELGRLRDSGVLTDEEFQREKQRILTNPA